MNELKELGISKCGDQNQVQATQIFADKTENHAD